MRTKARGFSLVEILTALFIVCVLVGALTVIYNASIKTVSAIELKLDTGAATSEIISLIADDIVKISSADTDTGFTLASKLYNGVTLYRMEIINRIYDNSGKELTYRKVVWQSDYDIITNTISLYRCISGMAVEDPVLSTQAKENPDVDIFVPVCRGLTYFSMQIPQVQDTPEGAIVNYTDKWSADEMPGGVMITLSFEPPVEYVTGQIEVPVEDRTAQTVSVNRSREYKFQFVAKDLDAAYGQQDEQQEEMEEQEQNGDEPADEQTGAEVRDEK